MTVSAGILQLTISLIMIFANFRVSSFLITGCIFAERTQITGFFKMVPIWAFFCFMFTKSSEIILAHFWVLWSHSWEVKLELDVKEAKTSYNYGFVKESFLLFLYFCYCCGKSPWESFILTNEGSCKFLGVFSLDHVFFISQLFFKNSVGPRCTMVQVYVVVGCLGPWWFTVAVPLMFVRYPEWLNIKI